MALCVHVFHDDRAVAPSDSEAGSYLRLIDFLYHSTLGLKAMNKKNRLSAEWVAHPVRSCSAIASSGRATGDLAHKKLLPS